MKIAPQPVLALIFALSTFQPVLAQYPSPNPEHPQITVSGEATVYVVPDRIMLTFGIETRDMVLLNAKQQNNDIQRRAVEAIRELGLEDKDLATDHLSIEPRYRYNDNDEQFLGYLVRNTFIVTLNDPAQVEELVTRVLQSGVNYIHGVEFQTTEFRKHRDQAREMALIAAREKAEAMAGALGARIGHPIQINESGSPWYYHSSWSGWGSRHSDFMSQNSIQYIPASTPEIGDTIALGKVSIRANVSVTFALQN